MNGWFQRMLNHQEEQEKSRNDDNNGSAATEEERGDSAREAIAALRAAPGGVDYDEAHRRAQEFNAAGRVADAQLMLFFAARGGHGPASFDLATLYDPAPHVGKHSVPCPPKNRWTTTSSKASRPKRLRHWTTNRPSHRNSLMNLR